MRMPQLDYISSVRIIQFGHVHEGMDKYMVVFLAESEGPNSFVLVLDFQPIIDAFVQEFSSSYKEDSFCDIHFDGTKFSFK